MRAFLAGIARAVGLDVRESGSAEAALVLLDAEEAELVITDLDLPGMDGYALLRELADPKSGRARPRIIVCSVHVGLNASVRREELEEADVLLPVPTTAAELIAAIHRVFENAPRDRDPSAA